MAKKIGLGKRFQEEKRKLFSLGKLRCVNCKRIKKISMMGKNKNALFGYENICKKCKSDYQKKRRNNNYLKQVKRERKNDKKRWYQKDGERKKYCRNRVYIKKYGISLEGYNKILKSQGYKCAICGKKQKNEGRALSVDHNHKTSFIRGLLCFFCNSRLLRYLHDNKKRTIGMIKYLQEALKNDEAWS